MLFRSLAYHSHSLRRTGATLLAIAGRSEEQIKTMGNWSSASAVIRYIENSEVSMRRNARAIAMPGFTAPEVMDLAPADLPADIPVNENAVTPKIVDLASTVVPAEENAAECRSLCVSTETDQDEEHACAPPPKKRSGIVFTGSIHQLIVVNSFDDAGAIGKK